MGARTAVSDDRGSDEGSNGRHGRSGPDRSRDNGGRSGAAYEKLRDLIVRGQLAPGSRIIETDVADRLGVSRTPVRAALQRLEQEGYIETADNGGRSRPTVSPLTKEDARELLQLVGAVEGLATRRAAEGSEEERASLVGELRALNDRLEGLASSERPGRHDFFDLDREFHDLVVEAAGGPRLRKLHDSIKPQAQRYVQVYLDAHRYEIHESVAEHEEVAAALEAGDADAAEAAMEANWRQAERRLRRGIEEIGERGSW